MAVSLLRRLAASAPVPVFAVAGRGARTATAWLRLHEQIELVDSPRHATVLVVVGEVPTDHAPALRQIHDQLPHPRAVAWWTGGALADPAHDVLPTSIVVTGDTVVDELLGAHRGLFRDERESSPALGPVDNPTKWKGVGPHGQGGEGMMGGTPYGRSMPMTGDDVRDGLQLDRVPLTLGPYHGSLPPGLSLELELQGDVVVACRVRRPGNSGLGASVTHDIPEADPVMVWLADLLRVHGLGDRAQHVLRAAFDDGTERSRLVSSARRSLYGSLRGVGEIEGEDALARFDRILADDGPTAPDELDGLLAEHLPGMEWSAAITTVWTLDPAPLEHPRTVPA